MQLSCNFLKSPEDVAPVSCSTRSADYLQYSTHKGRDERVSSIKSPVAPRLPYEPGAIVAHKASVPSTVVFQTIDSGIGLLTYDVVEIGDRRPWKTSRHAEGRMQNEPSL